MLDVDDQLIQSVSQTIKQFLPDDNSIMSCEEYGIGGKMYKKSVVYKDNLEFGFRPLEKSTLG